ncbi:hypothetical protein MJO28_012454 [Puccinia striiformis f. sp. tritici]|uniref:Uncharacterized protein n=1 Tax=Puccinia striiformis f. sp. tritici TaxID=168172 RepID=A0ACC0E0I6_9BASI|nr:hypothetical protein MJO28_012454 [Puccinia striiformis f. sp. tritici]
MTHVPGKTVTLPDGLSRRPPDPSEEPKDFDEEEQWIKPHPGFGIKEVYSANLADIRVALDKFGAITHVFLSKIASTALPSATVVFAWLVNAREVVHELDGAWDDDWVIKATLLEVTPGTGLALLLRIS